MSNNVNVRLKLGGLNQLMRSEPVQREVNRNAYRVAHAAGEDYTVHPSPHRWVARAFVQARKEAHISHTDRVRLLQALNEKL